MAKKLPSRVETDIGLFIGLHEDIYTLLWATRWSAAVESPSCKTRLLATGSIMPPATKGGSPSRDKGDQRKEMSG